MDSSRIQAIEDWVEQKNVHDMIFLGEDQLSMKFCRWVHQGDYTTDKPFEEGQVMELDGEVSSSV